MSTFDGHLNPMQIAYQTGIGVEDAKCSILNNLYKTLAHFRFLFVEFSSVILICFTSLYYGFWTS